MRRVVSVVVAVVLVGCSSADVPTRPQAPRGVVPGALRSVAAQGSARNNPPKRVSQRLAAVHPGFAGLYRTRDGVLNVAVTPGANRNAVGATVASEMRAMHRENLQQRFVTATYSFAQLERWEQLLLDNAPAATGMVTLAVDEPTNRLSVGVSSETARAAVQQLLTQLGVPPEAVSVTLVRTPTAFDALTDGYRPLRGGLQVEGIWTQNGPQSAICTYGVNVLYQGLKHMIVNSHCTQNGTPGGLIGAEFYQHAAIWSAFRYGSEVQDPAFRSDLYGCAAGNVCRYSDAALVQVDESASWDLAGIARTTARADLPTIYGTLTIDGSNPRIEIHDVISELLTGDFVEKVGRTTGWTGGYVTNTCEHVFFGGVGRLCNTTVQAGAGHGDSGSPVFWQSYSNQYYYLAGILWGGIVGDDGVSGSTYYLSNWYNVDYELGSILNDLDVIPPSDPGCGGPIAC